MSDPRTTVALEWTGRAPPHQDTFMAVGRFDALRDQWPTVAWSVVLHAPPGGFVTSGTAEAAMLSGGAPNDLLRPGSAFDVMEGPRMVARAVVLPAASARTGARPPHGPA